jgi:acetoin utilization protein AcuB
MLVGERMSAPVITVEPKTPISDALMLFRQKRIRRAPVIAHHRLVGIVSERDLLYASPSPVTSLSVWEMNYLLSKLTVDEVMTRQVVTVTHLQGQRVEPRPGAGSHRAGRQKRL